jgi:hypothetical protein
MIWAVASALCADSFEPQARRYNNQAATENLTRLILQPAEAKFST